MDRPAWSFNMHARRHTKQVIMIMDMIGVVFVCVPCAMHSPKPGQNMNCWPVLRRLGGSPASGGRAYPRDAFSPAESHLTC